MGSKSGNDSQGNHNFGDGASPGKIFVGGLHKDTSFTTFNKYFGKYGEITDSVIMKDRYTGHPRGFGFITYADPSVIDTVIEETHTINGKQVEIKRTIPKGASQGKDFKTKKIFVGGILTTVTDEEFKNFFSKYGKVVDHQIIRDHATNRSRGFGFIIFEDEQTVDDILAKGNMLDFAGAQVEVKKAEPKKPSGPPRPAFGSDSRARTFGDGFGDTYSGFGGGGFGSSSFRPGGLGARLGGYDGYSGGGSNDFGSGFGGFGGGGLGGYRGESSLGYSSRLGSYGGGFGSGYGTGGLGGYGRGGEGYGGYGGSSYGGGYDSGPSASFGGSGMYGNRGGYGSSVPGRYHPYAR